MKISIAGRKVYIEGDRVIAVALNNLVDRLEATTDMPEGWEYKLDVWMSKQKFFNTVLMYRSGQTIYVDLTKDMIPYGGKYEMQFVAVNGDLISRTEIFEMWVEDTVNQTPVYNPIPNEFLQIQEDIEKNAWEVYGSVDEAKTYSETAKTYYLDTVGEYEKAKQEALNAEQSAEQSSQSRIDAQKSEQESAKSAGDSKRYSEDAKRSAEEASAAKNKIVNMRVSAVTLNPDQDATVDKTENESISLVFGVPQGKRGEDGGYYQPAVDQNGQLDWTASREDMPQIPSVNIKGSNGFSPVITVSEIDGGHKISVQDETSLQEFNVLDGKGGEAGKDGYSPSIELQHIENGTEIIITDKDGEKTAQIHNGESGIYYGPDEPTDESVNAWIKPDGVASAELPNPSGLPDGYTLQTQGGQAVWGESAGGGSEMEFINSMTLDQAVTSGRIDVDTTGQPFVLSEAIATVKLPKGEMLNNPVYYWYFTADTKFYVNRSIGNGNEFSLIAEGNASIGYIKLYYTSVYSGTSGIHANLVEVNQNITMFRFANFDGVPLPAGTAISLYGKRKAV